MVWTKCLCFNGAAPFGARRWRCPADAGRRSPGFNGAAPFGARRCHQCGRMHGHSYSFNGAAPFGARRFAAEKRGNRDRLPASTGPRLLGRGDKAPWPAVYRHESASTGPRLLGRGDGTDANGRRFVLDLLQRGRAFWGAEIQQVRFSDAGADVASTGPRLLGRGDRR